MFDRIRDDIWFNAHSLELTNGIFYKILERIMFDVMKLIFDEAHEANIQKRSLQEKTLS